MNPALDPVAASTWRLIYPWLILLPLALTAGRIVGVERIYEPSMYGPPRANSYGADRPEPITRTWPKTRPEPTPQFSSNDRSRWATIYNLVENGTFVIGRRVDDPQKPKGYRDEGIIFRSDFASVDKVLNPRTHEFYSTKPPLLPVLVAGEYWLLKHGLGLSLDQDRWPVIIIILLTVNWLPLALFLVLLRRLVEQFCDNLWARLLVMATAGFGTFITTFAVTLNNHTPAAVAVLIAVYTILRSAPGERLPKGRILLAGFFASFATCMELPAAAFLATLGLWLLWREPTRTLFVGLPAVLLPIAAFLGTNYVAMGEWEPVYSKFGSEWYEYPGSHWQVKPGEVKRGIDFAAEPKFIYAFHLLLGHHGILSLTPVWLLTGIGIGMRLFGREGRLPAWLAGQTALVSGIVIAFYIATTNNYGGWTSGPRWLIWLTPLWLLLLLPAAEVVSRAARGRIFGYSLLGVSVFSVTYPVFNPWRHPWIYQMCEYFHWLRY